MAAKAFRFAVMAGSAWFKASSTAWIMAVLGVGGLPLNKRQPQLLPIHELASDKPQVTKEVQLKFSRQAPIRAVQSAAVACVMSISVKETRRPMSPKRLMFAEMSALLMPFPKWHWNP